MATFSTSSLFTPHPINLMSANMVMALKNIAIIGGILATIQACKCETCAVGDGKKM